MITAGVAQLARKYALSVVHVNQVGGNDSLVFDGTRAGFDAAGDLVTRARDFEEDLVVMDTRAPTARPEAQLVHPVAPSDPDAVLADAAQFAH